MEAVQLESEIASAKLAKAFRARKGRKTTWICRHTYSIMSTCWNPTFPFPFCKQAFSKVAGLYSDTSGDVIMPPDCIGISESRPTAFCIHGSSIISLLPIRGDWSGEG